MNGEDDDTDDSELFATYHRRKEFNALRDEIDDTEISDYVSLRLMMIRVKALQKHQEIMYNKNLQA
jgi:hypothetical protein